MKSTSALILLVFLLLFSSWASAETYEVTDSRCSGPGSFQDAVKQANENPGVDTISFTTNVNEVNGNSCGIDGNVDPKLMYMAQVTDDLVIEGNAFTINGNSLYVTFDGGSNRPGLCPQEHPVFTKILRPAIGFLRADDDVSVTVRNLTLKGLRAIAYLRQGVDLTLDKVTTSNIYDFYAFCDYTPIDMQSPYDQNVTIIDSRFGTAWNAGKAITGPPDNRNQFWGNAFILGNSGNGTVSISNSVFGKMSIPAVNFGGTLKIENTEFRESGFINSFGSATIVNSLFMDSNAQGTFQRIVASGGGTIELEASTVALGSVDCDLTCQDTTGPGAIIATTGGSINLKASAVGVSFPDPSIEASVLIREESGGNVTATAAPNPNWIQPVFAQPADALKLILDQPALLTDAPGLPVGLIDPEFFYAAVTPLLDDGGGTPGRLIDAVTDADTTNVLLSPIDGSPITKDIFGNPRTEAGGTVRNIGAVQLGLAPTLSLAAVGDSTASLNWTRPLDPSSGAITGYEVCFGTGTVPEPSSLGTDCKDGDGNPATLETIANAPDTLTGQVTGLTNGDNYWFLVRGVNPDPGPWSNAVTGQPIGPIGTPVVTAVPGGNSVDLSWTRPDDGGHVLARYHVFYRLVGETQWTFSQEVAVGDTLQASVGGLAGGTAYEFGVQAVSTDGIAGEIGVASATPLIVPARFLVTKAYSDTNTTPAEVTLACNSGLPLVQQFTIAPGSPVTFTLTNFDPGSVQCEVTESDGPENYVPSFDNGTTVSATSCDFDTVLSGGAYSCAITNTAGNALFTVTKLWVLTGEGFAEADYDVQVDVDCSADIVSVDGQPIIDPDGSVTVFLGDGESSALEVDTSGGPASCSAAELVTHSGVESVSEGCTDVALAAGDSAQCAFTNTVFFEGIPALDRYGLALLTLLMLGLGALGMRRSV